MESASAGLADNYIWENSLDALIAGVNIVELDPEDDSVGYGGLPNFTEFDSSGRVLLDGTDVTRWSSDRLARAGICLEENSGASRNSGETRARTSMKAATCCSEK